MRETYKIVQIMPCNVPMWAGYHENAGKDRVPTLFSPVVALALVEDEDGHRSVEAIDHCIDGLDLAENNSNFVGLYLTHRG